MLCTGLPGGGRPAAVNQLLEWDAELIDTRNEDGETPFIIAAFNGRVHVLKALYAKGGKRLLTQTNKDNWTALHWAASNGHSATVSQLLEWGKGDLLDIPDNDGKTPWDMQRIRGIMAEYKK